MAANTRNKTLIANWVEERQCAHLEEGSITKEGTLDPKLQRSGHKGLLSPNSKAPMNGSTMVQTSYLDPSSVAANIRTVGRRQEQILAQLYDMVSSEVHDEFNPPPPKPEYTSTTHKDFDKDFTPIVLPPTMDHDVYTESPITYWTENKNAVTGLSQIRVEEAPFRKNTAFSIPIEHYLDQPKPHDIN